MVWGSVQTFLVCMRFEILYLWTWTCEFWVFFPKSIILFCHCSSKKLVNPFLLRSLSQFSHISISLCWPSLCNYYSLLPISNLCKLVSAFTTQWMIQMICLLRPMENHFSSVAQVCPIVCDPMDCSTPGFSVHHQFPELAQTHAHRVGDAIQPSHPLSSPSPPAFSLSQHQRLFQWVSSSHQVAKVLEFQLHH